MGWVIWRDETGNDGNERRVYVRRITPNFVSFTVDPLDARKFDTKADARRALKGTGLSAYKVSNPDAPAVEAVPDAPADMPDMTTADPDEGADDVRQAVRDALRADEAADDGPPIPYT